MEAIWNDVAAKTKKFAKKPERFLLHSADSDDFEKSKILLKVFYDGVKLATSISDTPEASQKTLSELIIEDFDEEQVWAGIELQNKFVLDECREKLEQLQKNEQVFLEKYSVFSVQSVANTCIFTSFH